MATYLDLCNKVIQESANELDELTPSTWDSPEAGRRLYPRIKRMVAESWRTLQMSRDEWEFGSKELVTTLYPKIKFTNGQRSEDPVPGVVFRGQESGTEVTVRDSTAIDWQYRDVSGQLELESISGDHTIIGETFEEVSPNPGDGTFIYEQKGSYNLKDFDPLIRNIRYQNVVVYKHNQSPRPCVYIPWSNWTYKQLAYVKNTASLPTYFSEDYEGNLVFYPQTLDPFTVSLVYETAPQELEKYDDVPLLLAEEYHDWIAWRALENIAMYDKNPTLFAYANKWASFYEARANKAYMPTPRWGMNRYGVYR